MPKIKEKFINVNQLQDKLAQVIAEVENGEAYYKVVRYSEPKVAIIRLKDLEEGKSFICRGCEGKE